MSTSELRIQGVSFEGRPNRKSRRSIHILNNSSDTIGIWYTPAENPNVPAALILAWIIQDRAKWSIAYHNDTSPRRNYEKKRLIRIYWDENSRLGLIYMVHRVVVTIQSLLEPPHRGLLDYPEFPLPGKPYTEPSEVLVKYFKELLQTYPAKPLNPCFRRKGKQVICLLVGFEHTLDIQKAEPGSAELLEDTMGQLLTPLIGFLYRIDAKMILVGNKRIDEITKHLESDECQVGQIYDECPAPKTSG